MKKALLPVLALALTACGEWPSDPGATSLSVNGGFDEFGYNRTARIFNGTCATWAAQKGLGDYCGAYASDHLVMKWNAEWDRGNAESWANPPYAAWEDNEWIGAFPGGSGEVWHYKIKWVGSCSDGSALPDGSYCLWGQFAVVMDQGTSVGTPGSAHLWLAHSNPTGYGN